jgi:hypothetical protein
MRDREPEFNAVLLRKVNELELSVFSVNWLKNADIVYIGELVQKTKEEVSRLMHEYIHGLDQTAKEELFRPKDFGIDEAGFYAMREAEDYGMTKADLLRFPPVNPLDSMTEAEKRCYWSMKEISEILACMGLALGMPVPNWPNASKSEH